MIQIKPVGFIPKLDYTDYAWEELRLAGSVKDIEGRSEFMAVLTKEDGTPLLMLGVARTTLIGEPRFWFLMCNSFHDKVYLNLRALHQILPELTKLYPRLETLVEAEWGLGVKFARFCGFRETSRREDILGRHFMVMER